MSNNLSKNEIQINLKLLNSNWKLLDNKIQREFIFKDFLSAFNFIKEIADLAESLNHHPDIFNSYNNCILYISLIIYYFKTIPFLNSCEVNRPSINIRKLID